MNKPLLELPVSDQHASLAAALAGSRKALIRCSEAANQDEIGQFHRLGPALALRAQSHGIEGRAVDRWRRSLLRVAAQLLLFQQGLEQAGECLGAAGIDWVPLKGMDLSTRVYSQPEERPTTDIDLMIDPGNFRRARAVLESSGWEAAFPGAAPDAWILEEGHAWTAIRVSDRVALELHIRLWDMVPTRAVQELMTVSYPDDTLPAGGRRLPLAHAFVVTAVHGLLDAPPRPLFQWWDLERIITAGEAEIEVEIVELARRWDVELPLTLAAAQMVALWPNPVCARIVEELTPGLRRAERHAALRAARHGLDSLGASLSLARLVSGRSTRAGWKAVLRHFWAHPGMVAQETPSDWPPKLRRVYHVLNALNLRHLARWLARDRLGSTSREDLSR